MKRILWLCSWYPNQYNITEADFIQRQAQALSLFSKVHVLMVKDVRDKIKPQIEQFKNGNLTETIIYYHGISNQSLLKRIKSNLDYLKYSKSGVLDYVKENGVPDFVHVQVPVRACTTALWMKRKFGSKFNVTEHFGIYNKVASDRFEVRSNYYKQAVKKMFSSAEKLIVVSNELGENINEWVLKKKYSVIPNVVNTDFFNFDDAVIQTAQKDFTFLHVSNMKNVKNVEGIIDAVKTLAKTDSNFKLKIIGKPTESILNYAEQSGLQKSKLIFTGEISYPDVAKEMKNADGLLMFSKSESGSCVVQEALCCGLPVISTPVGIAKELITDSNGVLVPTDSITDLVKAMKTLKNNIDVYNRKIISETVINIFSYSTIGKKILGSYNF